MTELHLRMSEGLVVRRGDTLVVAMSAVLANRDAESLAGQLEEALPGVDIVVVGGASALAAYRPHEVECPTITTAAEHGADPGHDAADHPTNNG
ncbi:hypothetical protein [Micromonospora yangpuensis]|uniref:Uncharacterized protein n=1 Tax=Micromonospora yangpuensis TaxID=683228 RepID=A0A1C6VDU6_9ACTN|nr:hypothetical protein [Micromonospora yangpuensis]GGM14188.1 hypothetical protein GCM10012279_35400 [Micromonospora yangpuensis]SCL64526.1 hypothetical protein GA0070617_5495 [Micromonospora yangpuensis]